MKQRLEELAGGLRQHAFWPALVIGTLLASAAAGLAGLEAFRAAGRSGPEVQRLQRAERAARVLAGSYRPAAPDEQVLWSVSRQELSRLAVRANDRLSVAQVVARRADEVGLEPVRLRFLSADSAGPAQPVDSAGGVQLQPDAWILVVDAWGDYPAISEWLASLPRRVRVRALSIRRDKDALHASVTLSMYSAAGPTEADAAAEDLDRGEWPGGAAGADRGVGASVPASGAAERAGLGRR